MANPFNILRMRDEQATEGRASFKNVAGHSHIHDARTNHRGNFFCSICGVDVNHNNQVIL